MMRSLFSAVSGLKTHQSKMDVIGNNVANVNTVAFKSSATTFSEIMYQTISSASGANATTGKGGVNARQIGLGVTSGSTKITISSAGAAETTGDGFDIRLTDKSTTNFFIVNTGSQNLFTRAGSFYIDGAGNLAMTSTGYTVMGWQVDETTGDIKKDTVSALRVMQEKNLTSAPEATTLGTVAGIMDKNDTGVTSEDGHMMNLNFYDKLGYRYTARLAVKVVDADTERYTVELSDILDSNGVSILDEYLNSGGASLSKVFGENGTEKKTFMGSDSHISFYPNGTPDGKDPGYYYAYDTYDFNDPPQPSVQYAEVTLEPESNSYTVENFTYYTSAEHVTSGDDPIDGDPDIKPLTELFGMTQDQMNAYGSTTNPKLEYNEDTGEFEYTKPTVNYALKFSEENGEFSYVGGTGSNSVTLKMSQLGVNFEDIEIDFSTCKSAQNGGKTTLGAEPGINSGSEGAGRALGQMIGITINNDGRIYGSYDNGNTELLGQIAVAQFANASGLEKVGENCYTTTLNSGEFDGIGVDISADGSSMISGELEMSNVDLSTEFTQMIITQRGFQSNSRVITTSDTLLEELINLKR